MEFYREILKVAEEEAAAVEDMAITLEEVLFLHFDFRFNRKSVSFVYFLGYGGNSGGYGGGGGSWGGQNQGNQGGNPWDQNQGGGYGSGGGQGGYGGGGKKNVFVLNPY